MERLKRPGHTTLYAVGVWYNFYYTQIKIFVKY
jgi:hypothetical protein